MNWYGIHIKKPKTIQINTPLTAMSFYLTNPRSYNSSPWPSPTIQSFVQSLSACPNLSPPQIPIHSCLLINIPSETRFPGENSVRSKSIEKMNAELSIMETLGLSKYVLHPGTCKDHGKGLDILVQELKEARRNHPSVSILLENMTGTRKLCESFEQIDYVIRHAGPDGIDMCLDTAHCWGAGMPMDTLLDDLDRVVGLTHMKAIHLNDSKAKYGSCRDLHENIGEGMIGRNFFKTMIKDSRLYNVPCVLECPRNCHPDIQQLINECAKE